MRPKYESKQDRIAAREVADAVIAREPDASWTEFPPLYVVDFAIWRGAMLIGLIEVKCRNIPSTQYPDYAISETKWLKMIEEGRTQGVPVFLVARFTDTTLWTPVAPGTFKVYRGGRTDRGDKADVEMMIHIPWKKFKTLRGANG